MCLDVRGWLMNHTRKSDYKHMFRHNDGRFMTPDEAKAELLLNLAMGRERLPYGECPTFDYKTGCPGHEEATADAPIKMLPV
jgi:hypothetical protein